MDYKKYEEMTAVKAAFDKRTRAREIALKKRISELFGVVENSVLDRLVQSGTLSAGQIDLILNGLNSGQNFDEFNQAVSDAKSEAMTRGRRQELSKLQKAGVSLTFSNFSPTVLQILQEDNKTASQNTLNRLQGNIKTALEEGYKKGLGTKEIGNLVKEQFTNLKQFEAERIARTEINSAQNQGVFMTRTEMGVKKHQWWTALDDRVRDAHIEIHGEIVVVGEPFSNGLIYPGDKKGPIKEWINCRCTTIPILE